MRFGICNEMFEGWKLEDVFNKAAELGYDGVEIAPFTLGQSPVLLSSDRRRRIRTAAEKSGVEMIGLHWLLAKTEGFHLTSPDASVREATGDYLCELVQLCGDLGGSVLVLGSPQQRSLLPGVSPEDARKYAIDVLSSVARKAESANAVLCIEPLGPEETDFINTSDEGWKLAQDIHSPNVKIILDVKAMSTESRPVEDTIRLHAGHAGHVHANDPNRRGPGFGDTTFVPILKALNDLGYKGFVSVEVFDFKPDPVTIARESLEYMRGCLQGGSPQ